MVTRDPVDRSGGPVSGGDEFDDLFNYDAEFDEIFNSKPSQKDTPRKDGERGRGETELDLFKKVEVVKKPRDPRVKLDEHRLLSAAGIPKLKKRAKDLKFKGKGHEYSDATRLLQLYQLWLDDLFPKARFLDALAMVEKEGHKRHMQIVRQGWIDEGKPRSSVHEDSIFDEPALPRNNAGREQMATRNAPVFDIAARPVSDVSQRERLRTPAHGDRVDDDNIYDATPRAPRVAPAVPESAAVSGGSIFGPRKDAEEPDDLDALFADEEMEENGALSAPRPAIAATDEQDDLDALLAEAENENISPAATRTVAAEPDFDDEMEAMAGMDW